VVVLGVVELGGVRDLGRDLAVAGRLQALGVAVAGRLGGGALLGVVVAVVLGWGVAQYPWLLVDELTIEEAAGAPATLSGLLIVVVLAGVVVLPALVYLFWLTQSERWSRS
jgi:cytochrome bd-type quinol oxidase subunit 2